MKDEKTQSLWEFIKPYIELYEKGKQKTNAGIADSEKRIYKLIDELKKEKEKNKNLKE